jgi:nodulation protein E
MKRRVVITGAGTVNALAQDVPGTMAAMAAGACGIGALDVQDMDRLSVKIGAQIKGWDATRFGRDGVMYDRFTQFTLVAAAEAVAQSGLDFTGDLRLLTGVVLGTAGGGLTTGDDAYRAVYAEGKPRVHPFTVPRLMPSAHASQVSMAHGLQGPTFTVSTACASANHAMGLAFQMVRSGAAPVMLTGGADAMLSFGGIKAWEGLRVMSPTGCRPFCASRDGMVMGEGAGVFVFEDRDHALARGAMIWAEVAGFAMTADAGDIVMPSVAGAARTMQMALADAGLMAADIGYINAHGTGTAANDRVEAAAILSVFGHGPLVSSTKAMHGHVMGATGAIELLACLMALHDGVVAPTIGYTTPDADCPLDVVPNVARQAPVDACLSNAFAFGGLNAVLALRRG